VRSIGQWPAAVVSLALLVAGCGGGPLATDAGGVVDATPQEPMPVDTMVGNDAEVIDGGSCNAVIQMHADQGAAHVTCTTPTNYSSVPPSSGSHYPKWPLYQTYTSPIPWGNLVHALEHGAVVIVYNCPAGCDDEVGRAQALIDGVTDPACGTSRRIILMPDPTLDVRFAATSWTWTLRADCFEEATFGGFIADHLGHGLEAVCPGGYPTDMLCP
jgi:hypothetical protein